MQKCWIRFFPELGFFCSEDTHLNRKNDSESKQSGKFQRAEQEEIEVEEDGSLKGHVLS